MIPRINAGIKSESTPAEVRLRLRSILEKLEGPPTGDSDLIRARRGIVVLELVASAEAATLLEAVASGADEAITAVYARMALERLNR